MVQFGTSALKSKTAFQSMGFDSPSLRPLVALVCGAIKPDADDINEDSVKRITENINGDRIENEVQ